MTKEQYEDFRLMLKDCGAALPRYITLNRFERVWFSSIIEMLTEKDKQIEKMKCWCNCGNYRDCLIKRAEEEKELKAEECHNCTNWKLKE